MPSIVKIVEDVLVIKIGTAIADVANTQLMGSGGKFAKYAHEGRRRVIPERAETLRE